MKPTDAELIYGFLLQDFDHFRDYLNKEHDLEYTKASMILEAIAEESQGAIPTCTEQFSGFVGE
ncbi:hypothetical protein [uncultured Desulfosarcina sp.]|uniref:hypothetical protein n=1 Tax=uncultured Desulfosarcina sp. TaxID=218289 RepID=UPI0029C7E084|nr:hypothetical protein [uncultured Desulfosarcina sp.]